MLLSLTLSYLFHILCSCCVFLSIKHYRTRYVAVFILTSFIIYVLPRISLISPASVVSPAGESGGEKQPFLGGVEPVRLTPSWENTNLPKEELNFKNVSTFETFEVDMEPPKDR